MTLNDLRSVKGLLIDTNLLILLVIGRLDASQISAHNLTNSYTTDDYKLLISFISRFRSTVVTPNILTEASNLLETYSYKGQQALTLLQDIAKAMNEVYCESIMTMTNHHKSYIKFGLSDSVTYSLAIQNYLILTDDLKLCSYLQGQGLFAFNFNNLRTHYLLH
ncbi:hypothetical protein [Spirosoma sp. KNUC1025]|uniref:hypothetical protein n=1 Tax=Spirosoma sp. KNUC1025 TaxID=2894082 RepID=UPI00386B2DBC|nr:hypothetical protein LN737_11205 [Spirosoma sp. KNUC1025]